MGRGRDGGETSSKVEAVASVDQPTLLASAHKAGEATTEDLLAGDPVLSAFQLPKSVCLLV